METESATDISASIAFHRSHGKLVTVTAVQPTARFGGLSIVGTTISAFQEKPKGEGGWINGGFFVLSPESSAISPTKHDV
jgi:glucose-1-phosphate cytidylyltransferase